jgi:hypothetical protein
VDVWRVSRRSRRTIADEAFVRLVKAFDGLVEARVRFANVVPYLPEDFDRWIFGHGVAQVEAVVAGSTQLRAEPSPVAYSAHASPA